MLRVLVPFSKTFFFIDKGNEHGVSAELGRELEKWINKTWIWPTFFPCNLYT